MEADDEDDLVDQELQHADEELCLVCEDDQEIVEDYNGEEDSDSDVELESQSHFVQSSLNSIQRGVSNNKQEKIQFLTLF